MLLVCDGWAVYIYRNFPAECIVETVVLRGGRKVLVSADNVCDLHQMVIHNVCEVVGWVSVGFDKNHIVEVLVIRPELCEVFVLAECVQICEDGISLNLSRIAYL